VRLLFWSGQAFKEQGLKKAGAFKAAGGRYTDVDLCGHIPGLHYSEY
jgi:hypothetical protein